MIREFDLKQQIASVLQSNATLKTFFKNKNVLTKYFQPQKFGTTPVVVINTENSSVFREVNGEAKDLDLKIDIWYSGQNEATVSANIEKIADEIENILNGYEASYTGSSSGNKQTIGRIFLDFRRSIPDDNANMFHIAMVFGVTAQ